MVFMVLWYGLELRRIVWILYGVGWFGIGRYGMVLFGYGFYCILFESMVLYTLVLHGMLTYLFIVSAYLGAIYSGCKVGRRGIRYLL